MLHKNDNYEVEADPDLEIEIGGALYVGGYVVRNIQTGIVEFQTPTLPDALYTSEQLNHALSARLWEWRNNAKEKSAADMAVN